MNVISKIISIVFHPLLLATYLVALLGWLYPVAILPVQASSVKNLTVLIFISTFCLPTVNVYFFKSFGTISSFKMPLRKERIWPFFMILLLYILVTWLLYVKTGLQWGDNLFRFILVTDALVLVSFVLTLRWKVSIHSLAATAWVTIVGFTHALSGGNELMLLWLISIVVAGAIMSARLYLGAHTPREVYAGAAAGIVTASVSMLILF